MRRFGSVAVEAYDAVLLLPEEQVVGGQLVSQAIDVIGHVDGALVFQEPHEAANPA